jgi:Gly-Xaa carboxypeptidase
LIKLASHYNLTFNAFGQNIGPDVPSSGTLTLSDAYIPGLEPAPVTPSDAAPYQLLSGTIKATYNSHRSLQGSDNIYVAPGMMTGNTGMYVATIESSSLTIHE